MDNSYEEIKAEKAARQLRYVEKVIENKFPANASRSSRAGSNRKSKAPLSPLPPKFGVT